MEGQTGAIDPKRKLVPRGAPSLCHGATGAACNYWWTIVIVLPVEDWGEIVLRICFSVALSAAMMLSFAKIANSQTAAPPQNAVPPAIAKDCAARILKDGPQTKIVGPFVRVQPSFSLARAISENRVLYIAAPTSTPTTSGRIFRSPEGCKYFIRDGKLEFDRMIPLSSFPPSAKSLREE